jgi:hypothetical protein
MSSSEKPVDRWLGLVGIAVGIVFFLLPKTQIIVAIALMSIFGLLFRPLWNFWWIENSIIRRVSAMVLFLVALGIVGNYSWPSATAEAPDMTARFVYPEAPALALLNISKETAWSVGYEAVIWNLDQLDPLQNPLTIPTFRSTRDDYVRAGEFLGPEPIFEQPSNISPKVNRGNRLFGFIRVFCPDCKMTRDVWVYIIWGQGGWVAEPRLGQRIDLVALFKKIPVISRNLDQFIAAIPVNTRIPIDGSYPRAW